MIAENYIQVLKKRLVQFNISLEKKNTAAIVTDEPNVMLKKDTFVNT